MFRLSVLLVSCFTLTFIRLNVMGDSIIRQLMIQEVEELEIDDKLYVHKTKARMNQVSQAQAFNISDHKLIKFLSDIQSATKEFQSTLGSFSWSQCDAGSPQLVTVNSLSLTPNPLRFPGTVYFSFDVNVTKDFDAPLKAVVEVEKKIAFLWVHIPCIDNVGSCTYDDLCDMISKTTCPEVFVESKVPCKCPFTKGHFTIPVTGITVNKGGIPGGDYKVKLELYYSSTIVYCINLSLAIS